MLQEWLLCGPSYSNWVLISIGHSCVGLTFSLADMINTDDSVPADVLVLTTAGSGACPNLLLNMLLVQLIGSCLDIVWSWPLGMYFLGPLGRDSITDQYHVLPVSGPGQPVWSSEWSTVFCLSLLGLGVHGKNQAVHQSQLFPALGPEADHWKSPSTLRCASTSQLPVKLSHWKSPWRHSNGSREWCSPDKEAQSVWQCWACGPSAMS